MMKMDRQEWMERAGKAVDAHEEGTPQLFLYELMGFSFTYDEDKEVVRIKAPVSDIMFNPVGFIHGGILHYLADTAMGHLCAAFLQAPAVSLELKTQYFATVKEGHLHAEARFKKKGKTVQFIVCDIKDDDGRVLSETTGTFYKVPQKD